MNKLIVLGLLVAAPLSAPAVAAPNGNQAPADTAGAIQSMETYTRAAPNDGGAFIELASSYVRAGRMPDAFAAYRRALALDNVMLEMPNGDAIWSHEVAKRALDHEQLLTAR